MRRTNDERNEARELYVMGRIRNLTRLEKITGITRKTLGEWRDKDAWDAAADVQDVTPYEILKTYLRQISRLQKQIDEKEAVGEAIEDSTLKRLSLYHKLAKQINADFDVPGMVLKFAEEYIDFVSGLPDRPGKATFVATLEEFLPTFIDFVIHGKQR
jgi:hypothetical protein